MRIAGAIVVLAALLLASRPSSAIEGAAAVIDGDSLTVGGAEIRLRGIDAPEYDQHCGDPPWPCGARAAAKLRDLVAGWRVRCRPVDVDRYGRIVAVCRAGGRDLGRAMVVLGLALAYRKYDDRYAGFEDAARAAKAGMWSGPFTPPWEWRKAKRRR